jgi:hypothetical protein
MIVWVFVSLVAGVLTIVGSLLQQLTFGHHPTAADLVGHGELLPAATALAVGTLVRLLNLSGDIFGVGRLGLGGVALVIILIALPWFTAVAVLLAVGQPAPVDFLLPGSLALWSFSAFCGACGVILGEWQ